MWDSWFSQKVLQCLFWTLPFWIPFASLMLWKAPTQAEQEAGLGWLALPADLPGRDNPLDAWSLLASEVLPPGPEGESTSGPLKPAKPLAVVQEPDQPAPVRLSGRILSGSRVMYCFFDTRKEIWFRLGEGESDSEAGWALRQTGDGFMELSGPGGGPAFRFDPTMSLLDLRTDRKTDGG